MVNTTSNWPATCAGVATITDVLVTVPKVPAVPPNVTAVVPVKLVPVIVKVVDPAAGPLICERLVIVGAATYVYVKLFDEPPGVVTITGASKPAA